GFLDLSALLLQVGLDLLRVLRHRLLHTLAVDGLAGRDALGVLRNRRAGRATPDERRDHQEHDEPAETRGLHGTSSRIPRTAPKTPLTQGACATRPGAFSGEWADPGAPARFIRRPTILPRRP